MRKRWLCFSTFISIWFCKFLTSKNSDLALTWYDFELFRLYLEVLSLIKTNHRFVSEETSSEVWYYLWNSKCCQIFSSIIWILLVSRTFLRHILPPSLLFTKLFYSCLIFASMRGFLYYLMSIKWTFMQFNFLLICFYYGFLSSG